MLEHGLRTPTGHIARQTRWIDEIRPRMTVVEEEVFWLISQFAEDLHQMHQEPDLLQLSARASMGSLELHSDAMGSARRLRRPCARRIGEVPKGAHAYPSGPWLPSHRALSERRQQEANQEARRHPPEPEVHRHRRLGAERRGHRPTWCSGAPPSWGESGTAGECDGTTWLSIRISKTVSDLLLVY